MKLIAAFSVIKEVKMSKYKLIIILAFSGGILLAINYSQQKDKSVSSEKVTLVPLSNIQTITDNPASEINENKELQAVSENTPSTKLLPTQHTELEVYQLGLNPDLYLEVIEQAKSDGGSFLFMNSHWIDVSDYTDMGEPIFRIIHLRDFSPDALKYTKHAFEYRLDQLGVENEYGSFDVDLETDIKNATYDYFGSNNSYELGVVNCRERYCLLSMNSGDLEDLELDPFHSQLMALMKSRSEQNLTCVREQVPGADKNYYFYYKCKKVEEST